MEASFKKKEQLCINLKIKISKSQIIYTSILCSIARNTSGKKTRVVFILMYVPYLRHSKISTAIVGLREL